MRGGCRRRRGYNGWPNYETWAVALWLGNEEVSYRFWMAVARGVKLMHHARTTSVNYK